MSIGEINGEAIATPETTSLNENGVFGLNYGEDGYIYEEFLSYLRMPYCLPIYLEMASNDPVIGAIMTAAKQLVKGTTFSVKPTGNSLLELEAAEFIKECMDDMSQSWLATIENIISYFEYGWSFHEIVYKKRMGNSKDPRLNSHHNDGFIGWRKIADRSQTSWSRWGFRDGYTGELEGMYQWVDHRREVFIPLTKGLLFRSTVARNNPEGKSFLRNAYRPWYYKKHIEDLEGIGVERNLAGMPVLTAPENCNIWDLSDPKGVIAKRYALRLIKSIKRDSNEGVLIPFGWDLKLLSSTASPIDTNTIINRYDQRIAITLLADIVMLGADKVGSFALANVKQGLLAAVLDAQLADILAVFNKFAIPKLLNMNPRWVRLTKYPSMVASAIKAPSMEELAKYITSLSGSGMPLFPDINLENHLRQVANMPLTEEEAEARQLAKEKAVSQGTQEGNQKTNQNQPGTKGGNSNE